MQQIKATRKPKALPEQKTRRVFISITEIELAKMITALDWQPDEQELMAKLGCLLADSILSQQP
jgi:hypothetical protein